MTTKELIANLQTVTLPWPPSANRYWRHTVKGGRAITYLTPEGKAYKSAGYIACIRRGVRRIDGPVKITFHLYRPAKRGDIDNYTPLCQDAIRGRAYGDDDQIIEMHTYRHEDKHNPRVEVTVESATESSLF